MSDLSTLWELFFTFGKIGLFTFGGGYAMISLITSICVEQKQWITQEEMLDLTVIAESTPGPIAINCATFVGYRLGGIRGSIAATFGMVLPSFVIIYLISLFLENVNDIRWVTSAFQGIRVCVAVLILDVGVKMVKKMKKKALPRAIMAISCAVMVFISLSGLKLSSIALMLCAGMVSLSLYIFRQKGVQA